VKHVFAQHIMVFSAITAVACSIGCSRSKDKASGNAASYAIWDPYPQFDDSSGWVQLLNKCGAAAGVTIKRTAFDTSDLTSKALLGAQQHNSPDVLIVDNPVVSTLAEGGVLATTEDTKIDAPAVQPNLLAAG
jgi:multiple sugar transport system substrate-binding protein